MTCFRSLRSLLLVLFVLTVSGTQWRLAGGGERVPLVSESPSILWICVDDMSDWLSCYGEPVIRTPHLDLLAEQGIRFENAFMPSPVCSTSRSALITGQMQTSLGLHHHRTMLRRPLPPDVLTLPEHFRRAGYLTFNESKDDYNFARDRKLLYSPGFKRPGFRGHVSGSDYSWLGQLRNRKFFGQLQFKGGKIGGETGSRYPAKSRVAPSSVTVPPQYPDDPVFRNAIARHYEQILQTDEQVGQLLSALKEQGLWNRTILVFFSDHGCPLPRSKQFLYDEGIRVPLIVRFPAGWKPGFAQEYQLRKVRRDLVSGIDLAATTLALAGIPVPQRMEGRSLFGKTGRREYVIAARDRCGIAVDRIRAVRTLEYSYIRNYYTDRPLYQSNYRDGYSTFRRLAELNQLRKLSAAQGEGFEGNRAAEELYDLGKDPHQLVNLAQNGAYREALQRHRRILQRWEQETNDQGRVAESHESLRKVYETARGKVQAPEFDFLKEDEPAPDRCVGRGETGKETRISGRAGTALHR
ncbi:MAG: sulfatase [Planctomycetota bacterium]|nr:sulfatase [Planctomycetota bacterium]